MKTLKVGDTKTVICNTYESLQTVTFKLRNVPLSDGSGFVKNILVGVCDTCDSIAALPHQSTLAIREAERIVRQEQVIRLSPRDTRAFLLALEHPPKPNAALLAAAQRYKNTVVTGYGMIRSSYTCLHVL